MARHYNFTDLVVTATDDDGHSATLVLYQGDLGISGVVPGGRTPETLDSQGEWAGSRRGPRSYPTITFGGTVQATSAMSAFEKLLSGLTAGFVSVTDDVSDFPAVDLSIIWTHHGQTQTILAEDVECDGIDTKDGSPVSKSYSLAVRGPYTENGETIIASR